MSMPASAPRTLGVIGGMGPLATVDFLHKLVLATPAQTDQQHIPLRVRFCPEVPDRVDALLAQGPSPGPALAAAALALQRDGAQALVMPCHTAHVWADEIAAAVHIPLLNLVDLALAETQRLADGRPFGLLASSGTLQGGIYAARGAGVRCMLPTEVQQRDWVAAGIRDVKAGRLTQASDKLVSAAQALVQRGASVVLMACTEVPLALAGQDVGAPLVDATDVLARRAVAWAMAPGTIAAPSSVRREPASEGSS